MIRIGYGYDVHPFEKNKKLIIGGIQTKHPNGLGLSGHSDADVLTHAIIDALIGAFGYGSIGEFFPETDTFKDSDSIELLKNIMKILNEREEFKINNIDATVLSSSVRIFPLKEQIKQKLSTTMNMDSKYINIKGKSGNTLGIAGKDKGIEAHCVLLVKVK
ncbi:2-C-methyl-D-erythritol 2,4-cyclodiphosphate synthase [Geotoga petraea]|uniref:2-C-methyl-D-erythritol 2,4-cyclodiphosphate synthase n=1 Tax=Geotoga petraea TaxID=28234 RepID=A0A1G6NIC2_9BACT|nr:2-C-methyl-D-erythritol 2,4-cyclodiphosphate synthase [Geotoga petraea]SDC67549.1 2-C-methyl-D-erythritol 2,4-cyclodiphosphate synthase [Geotoga petraea]